MVNFFGCGWGPLESFAIPATSRSWDVPSMILVLVIVPDIYLIPYSLYIRDASSWAFRQGWPRSRGLPRELPSLVGRSLVVSRVEI